MTLEQAREIKEIELKVAGTTSPKVLSAAICGKLLEDYKVFLVAMGPQAISQAVKAMPVVNGRMASKGKIYLMLPAFANREVKDETTGEDANRTVIVFRLIPYRF